MWFAARASIMDEKRRNVWKSKNLANCASIFSQKLGIFENLKISNKNENLKILKKKLNIFPSIFFFNIFRKKIRKKFRDKKKSQNQFYFLFSMTKIFLIEISRKIYFEHSFDSKTHVCAIRRDLVSWPIVQDHVKFCKISKILLKKKKKKMLDEIYIYIF